MQPTADILQVDQSLMAIPDDAVKYILFQRTAYLLFQHHRALNAIVRHLPFYTYNRRVLVEALLFKNRIKRLFSQDMAKEYEILKPHLPDAPQSVLDIGCGVAGIDITFAKHYAKKRVFPSFYLLDKTEVNDSVYYGIENTGAYYNSLGVAKTLLLENGATAAQIHLQEVSSAPIFPGVEFDLVVSLISWGFHYPMTTYLDEVHRKLKHTGKLIVDVRKGTDGAAVLAEKFGPLNIIGDFSKYLRVLATKN